MPITYQYIYGPVHSWRLGISFGIDPISHPEKVCNYDCIYCQLGPTTHWVNEREEFVPTASLLNEISSLPDMAIDYFTFSGRGEPTLASNLGAMIRGLKRLRMEKIAVITNSSLLHRPDVQDDLTAADFVLAKLDGGSGESFERIDNSRGRVDFSRMVNGLRSFRQIFKGKLALQMMFIAENKNSVSAMADVACTIGADEIEINTPTRPCKPGPLDKDAIEEIKEHFWGIPVVTVYDREVTAIEPLDRRKTVGRHGRYFSSS